SEDIDAKKGVRKRHRYHERLATSAPGVLALGRGQGGGGALHSRGGVPDSQETVGADGGQARAVGAERPQPGRAPPRGEREQFPAGGRVPDLHAAVAVSRGESLAVGAPRQTGGGRRVPPQGGEGLAAPGAPEFDAPLASRFSFVFAGVGG